LVSASRKKEWILPKGGWDNDESKEECAARETFEEGGLLGSLGGCLSPIDYETAKAKKRRLSKQSDEDEGGKSIADCELKRSRADNEESRPPLCKRPRSERTMTGPESSSSTLKKAGLPESPSGSGTSSVNLTPARAAKTSFDPKHYSYVRLFLFPLYVSSVKSDWPEKGRLRKLVDIDEAIEIMDAENRLYFKKGLEMLKEKGLHLLKP
jgi:diphosphoinositol-polyphosphate diphosphatase